MIDYHVVVQFLEDNYADFVQYCGGENTADETINELRKIGGMATHEPDKNHA